MTQEKRLVSIGRIYRHHGFPRDGVSYFKMKFPLPGGESLKGQSRIWLSHSKRPHTEQSSGLKIELSAYQAIELPEAPKPQGGKWGQASGAILALPTEAISQYGESLNGHDVALERAQFPATADGEFYLCDLIGAEVWDEAGQKVGSVQSYTWLTSEVYNLEVLAENGESFDFPAKWIDWSQSEISPEDSRHRKIVVPDISQWMKL